eukprot:TRINITY_DN2349_c0_g4_i2.p1 TRINITY_DN2349_c0_g4~~TRINITY_DN2349_c0_g4_i2.p1  ORF type:complete len:238 (+),score=60.12 TRINITY_DN2349_c0_g4_i2:51-764(+)
MCSINSSPGHIEQMDKEPLVLGYWKIRGLAEPIRLLLQHLGVNYKEVLYGAEGAEDWFKVKYTLGLDFPNIPYLFDSSFKLTESTAILRYICHKYDAKLLGETVQEMAYVDMLTGMLGDINNFKGRICYEADPAKIPPHILPSLKGKVKDLAKVLEKKKYLLGDKLSYVDFLCMEYLECINDLIEPVFTTYPSLKKHFDTMMSLPNVKKYKTSERFTKDPLSYNGNMARLGGAPLKK